MRTSTVSILSLLTVLGTSPALAQDASGTDTLATDVSPGEAPTLKMRETRFRFLDVDGDGHVVRDELDADDGTVRSMFPSLDADGDGRLGEEEFVASHRDAIE